MGPTGLRERTLWYQEVAPFGARLWLPGYPVVGKAVTRFFSYGSERERTEVSEPLARPVEKDLSDEKLLTYCVVPGQELLERQCLCPQKRGSSCLGQGVWAASAEPSRAFAWWPSQHIRPFLWRRFPPLQTSPGDLAS